MSVFSLSARPAITSLTSSATDNKVILPRKGTAYLNIYCNVNRGSHPVTFQWSHDGGSVQGSFTSTYISGNEFIGRLYISNLTSSHNGRYVCSTQNTVGSSSSSLSVIVIGMYGTHAVKQNFAQCTSEQLYTTLALHIIRFNWKMFTCI